MIYMQQSRGYVGVHSLRQRREVWVADGKPESPVNTLITSNLKFRDILSVYFPCQFLLYAVQLMGVLSMMRFWHVIACKL